MCIYPHCSRLGPAVQCQSMTRINSTFSSTRPSFQSSEMALRGVRPSARICIVGRPGRHLVPRHRRRRRRLCAVRATQGRSLRRRDLIAGSREIRSHSVTDVEGAVSENETSEPAIQSNKDGTYLPSSYRLPAGQLSTVNRSRPIQEEDKFQV